MKIYVNVEEVIDIVKVGEIDRNAPIAMRLVHSLINSGNPHLRKHYEILRKFYEEGEANLSEGGKDLIITQQNHMESNLMIQKTG